MPTFGHVDLAEVGRLKAFGDRLVTHHQARDIGGWACYDNAAGLRSFSMVTTGWRKAIARAGWGTAGWFFVAGYLGSSLFPVGLGAVHSTAFAPLQRIAQAVDVDSAVVQPAVVDAALVDTAVVGVDLAGAAAAGPVAGAEPARTDWPEQSPQEGARPGVLLLPPDSLPPTEALMGAAQPLGLATLPAEPTGNPRSVAAVELGRRLFFDPLLSADRTVSCATCHQPDHGLASPEPLAVGIGGRVGRRNAPSLFNRVYGQRFFWDGRADSLEAQSLLPIANPEEMGDDLDAILLRLAEHPEYPQLFEAAFSHSTGSAAVTAEHMAAALAAFQRTLLLGDSPVDRFRSASDVSGLSLEARQGLWIFESRGRCWQCHSGENFSDEQFHNTGVGFGADNRDVGRFEVTGAAEDRFRFKTPSLRGVAQTAPYMHDGSVRTLEDVVEFYNRGGSPEDRELSSLMRPLNLSDEEKRYLVEFLRALSYQAGPSTEK